MTSVMRLILPRKNPLQPVDGRRYGARILAIMAVCLSLCFLSNGLAEEAVPADRLMELGQSSYRQGGFAHALQYWMEAARLYEEQGSIPELIKAQVSVAQALHQTGHYKEAGAMLTQAGRLAAQIDDGMLTATIKGRLSTVLFALGENEQALQLINEALALAEEFSHPALTAALLNDQGNILTAEKRFSPAIDAYTESSRLAKASNQPALMIIALINSARAGIQGGSLPSAKVTLQLAGQEIASAPDSYDAANAWLTLGEAYEDLLHLPPLSVSPSEEKAGLDADTLRHAAGSYWNAIQIAARIGDLRSESYGWGYLGHVYEMVGRTDEALDLTRRAVLAAQKIRSPESLYRWDWQVARLMRSNGRTDEAILAYQRAIENLQPIRSEFLMGSRNRQFSFRETTGNLFFELSDVLLQRASSTPDQNARQRLLKQAQDTVELYKAAELQDYFRDECVATARSRSTDVAQQSKTTAIVYPIILPDRLELLVSLPTEMKQFIVPIPSGRLTQEIRAFRLALEKRTSNAYLPHAQKFYDRLIRPMEADLAAGGITTLVFVPDGPLRTIPMAPLHDGTQFLIERYAIATTPGLTLTDSRPLNRKRVHVFSVGLTEAVQGFPPLPYVAQELSAVQSIYGGTQLLNDEFRTVQVEKGLKEQPYNIIHIASHGRVESDGTKSFILTFDDRITMDRLSALVGLFEFRTAPLELLTLSACETAAGDDRAALGLAGMAVKAGAKSALATLWFIEDEATAELIGEFYKNLQNPAVSKAAALQQAQLALLKNPDHAHPSLWAPFLLINNWL
ncbi:CHAT domain-containing protein [Nitrospira sp. Nam80]